MNRGRLFLQELTGNGPLADAYGFYGNVERPRHGGLQKMGLVGLVLHVG
jgi:hypothetical protein